MNTAAKLFSDLVGWQTENWNIMVGVILAVVFFSVLAPQTPARWALACVAIALTIEGIALLGLGVHQNNNTHYALGLLFWYFASAVSFCMALVMWLAFWFRGMWL